VDLQKVHVFPETSAFCQALNLDPLGLIASGALLVAAAPNESVRMVEALGQAGIEAAVIGQVVEGPAMVQARTPEGLMPLPLFEQDELTRLE